jgi:hypothetical protein
MGYRYTDYSSAVNIFPRPVDETLSKVRSIIYYVEAVNEVSVHILLVLIQLKYTKHTRIQSDSVYPQEQRQDSPLPTNKECVCYCAGIRRGLDSVHGTT